VGDPAVMVTTAGGGVAELRNLRGCQIDTGPDRRRGADTIRAMTLPEMAAPPAPPLQRRWSG